MDNNNVYMKYWYIKRREVNLQGLLVEESGVKLLRLMCPLSDLTFSSSIQC
jgi:hypothetical protein